MNVKKQFFDGLINQNPSLVQLLGMCPLLAITTSMFNGLGMGLAVTIILTCSNVVISALRKIIPNKVRIACYIVVIAGFVTMVDLLLKGFVPALSESLGLFIPPDRGELHHPGPCGGLCFQEQHWGLRSGRHFPGLWQHDLPDHHEYHP